VAHPLIDRTFFESIINFEKSEQAQDYYYKVMDTVVERDGKADTVRNRILRTYSMLFCDDLGAVAGQLATPEDVEATADRLHTGTMGYDPKHWYRMQHHFPIIDEDNYDRFAALVIADLNVGPLREAAMNNGDMLLVGEPNSLTMTREQRSRQRVRVVRLPGESL
jgi:hypothetical protein